MADHADLAYHSESKSLELVLTQPCQPEAMVNCPTCKSIQLYYR